MAIGRLASGSIAAGAATQLYRNATGNAQVITLLASSQVSGSTPKLNVKITNENFSVASVVTTLSSGTNHTLDENYPTVAEQLADGTGTWMEYAVDHHGSRLHLGVGQKNTTNLMGQAWSMGYSATQGGTNAHPWGKVSFGGQPICIGGSNGGLYRYDNADRYFGRMHMPQYDPYYFENPNAYNQNKARGIVSGNDASPWYHIEDISKMPTTDLMKYYNPYLSAGSEYYTHAAPSTDATTYGTVTSSTPGYTNRGWVYDVWTGIQIGWSSNGSCSTKWWNENSPGAVSDEEGDRTSNGSIFPWSNGGWGGSDPMSYDNEGRGSVYGCYIDIDHGMVVAHHGNYGGKMAMKYFKTFFTDGTMDNKGTRAYSGNYTMTSYTSNSYFHHMQTYNGTDQYFKLQWVKYNPNTDKHYVCFWYTADDASYSADPPVRANTSSYAEEGGIFEIDTEKIYGAGQGVGNTYAESLATMLSQKVLIKVADTPDAVSGLMSKPMRLKESLWTSHCQNGKFYYSTDLVTWAEQDSTTHFSTDYAMVNASKKGTASTDDVSYYVASGSKSVLYSFSQTVTTDVYDQASAIGVIAKGAVTPYEQKAIILSDGDAIYVENEDATNAISITAMGVDI